MSLLLAHALACSRGLQAAHQCFCATLLSTGMADPCSRACNPNTVRVTDHAWVGPSAASEEVWSLGGTLPRWQRDQQPRKPLIEVLPDGPVTATPGAVTATPRAVTATPASASASAQEQEKAAGLSWGLGYRPGVLPSTVRKLHLPSLVQDVSVTYAGRAEQVKPLLKEFMFAIPKVRMGRHLVCCLTRRTPCGSFSICLTPCSSAACWPLRNAHILCACYPTPLVCL